MPTTFPSSAAFGHPLSSARSRAMEEPPLAYGPTEILVPTTPREERRLPEDQDAFHRHGYAKEMSAKGLLPPAFAPALSLTPPTLFPQREECS
jgi:hypothetical protein